MEFLEQWVCIADVVAHGFKDAVTNAKLVIIANNNCVTQQQRLAVSIQRCVTEQLSLRDYVSVRER